MTCEHYSPDLMAMGDCKFCGHTYESHHPRSLVAKKDALILELLAALKTCKVLSDHIGMGLTGYHPEDIGTVAQDAINKAKEYESKEMTKSSFILKRVEGAKMPDNQYVIQIQEKTRRIFVVEGALVERIVKEWAELNLGFDPKETEVEHEYGGAYIQDLLLINKTIKAHNDIWTKKDEKS